MRKFKKRIISMVLAVATVLSFGCVSVFAANDVPADLPEGTVKIAEGIYMYEKPESAIETCNHIDWTIIDEVPQYGDITQPNVLSNVIVEKNHKYLIVRISRDMRVNLVRGTQSVFGSNMGNWPTMGGSKNKMYYIEASYYDIEKGVPYQMQLSSNGPARTNVEITYTSNTIVEDYMD